MSVGGSTGKVLPTTPGAPWVPDPFAVVIVNLHVISTEFLSLPT